MLTAPLGWPGVAGLMVAAVLAAEVGSIGAMLGEIFGRRAGDTSCELAPAVPRLRVPLVDFGFAEVGVAIFGLIALRLGLGPAVTGVPVLPLTVIRGVRCSGGEMLVLIAVSSLVSS